MSNAVEPPKQILIGAAPLEQKLYTPYTHFIYIIIYQKCHVVFSEVHYRKLDSSSLEIHSFHNFNV